MRRPMKTIPSGSGGFLLVPFGSFWNDSFFEERKSGALRLKARVCFSIMAFDQIKGFHKSERLYWAVRPDFIWKYECWPVSGNPRSYCGFCGFLPWHSPDYERISMIPGNESESTVSNLRFWPRILLNVLTALGYSRCDFHFLCIWGSSFEPLSVSLCAPLNCQVTEFL